MSKVAILGDQHHGMRKDSQKFHKFAEQFYSNVFFPYLDKHNITEVYQLGDLFDNRKSISPLSLCEVKRYFFDPLKERNIVFYTLLGNHDIFWRESLAVNSSSLLLGEYNNIVVINKPTRIGEIDMIPWICKENAEEIADYMKNSFSKYCCGHFEISGFKMYKGAESHGGISKELFKHYNMVFSGHYHTRSCEDNILYVGTPMEMTWQDYDDPRGFHTLDLNTGEIEFIKNPYTIFEKIQYHDDHSVPDLPRFKDKFIKVEVLQKNDLYTFDAFINKLQDIGAYDIKVVENLSSNDGIELDEKLAIEDTIGMLNNYIDSAEIQHKDEVKRYLKGLYTQALNQEIM